MNHQGFGFFEEKLEDLNISCLGQAQAETELTWLLCSALVAWTCLVCLKAGPTLVAMALLIGQIKELDQSEQRGLELWASI